jgi:hypothetical protein
MLKNIALTVLILLQMYSVYTFIEYPEWRYVVLIAQVCASLVMFVWLVKEVKHTSLKIR